MRPTRCLRQGSQVLLQTLRVPRPDCTDLTVLQCPEPPALLSALGLQLLCMQLVWRDRTAPGEAKLLLGDTQSCTGNRGPVWTPCPHVT